MTAVEHGDPEAPAPASGWVEWRSVFGNDRPVEIEIGPGTGEVLFAFAQRYPQRNFFAIEHLVGRAAALDERARAAGLANVRVVGADARCVLRTLVAPGTVTAIHVYFPDPWPKNGHRGRRLFGGDAGALMRRVLASDGVVHVLTDLPALLRDVSAHLTRKGLRAVEGARPPEGRPTTRFERNYGAAGIHYARFARDQRIER